MSCSLETTIFSAVILNSCSSNSSINPSCSAISWISCSVRTISFVLLSFLVKSVFFLLHSVSCQPSLLLLSIKRAESIYPFLMTWFRIWLCSLISLISLSSCLISSLSCLAATSSVSSFNSGSNIVPWLVYSLFHMSVKARCSTSSRMAFRQQLSLSSTCPLHVQMIFSYGFPM